MNATIFRIKIIVSAISTLFGFFVFLLTAQAGQNDASAFSSATSASERSGRGTINGHEWVDLGLPSGVLWATCNVGASSPSDYGNYYAWGETSTKSSYEWSNLKYASGESFEYLKFSKYVSSSGRGSIDNKTELEFFDDAARANWDGSWRMPTKDEWIELIA